jgi:hypothetical protein
MQHAAYNLVCMEKARRLARHAVHAMVDDKRRRSSLLMCTCHDPAAPHVHFLVIVVFVLRLVTSLDSNVFVVRRASLATRRYSTQLHSYADHAQSFF